MAAKTMTRGQAVVLAAAAAVGGLVLSHNLAVTFPWETPPQEAGLVKADPSQIISQTVQSLHAENKWVVYRYSGDARVKSTDVYAGFLEAKQELIVPGSVAYFIDMSQFSQNDVHYDKASNTIEIEIPPLMVGDIALQPERSVQINDGFLTVSSDVTERLAKRNYNAARYAFFAQAKNPELVHPAQEQAIRNVQAQFEIPLRAMGRDDVHVSARFR